MERKRQGRPQKLFCDNWSVKEKTKLAELLKEYPLNAYTNIAKKLKTKDADQVEDYITHLCKSVNASQKKPETVKAPLEQWLTVASDLVKIENFDCSTNLSKVMSIISYFEDLPEASTEGARKGTQVMPDYRAIYRYLGQMLQGDRREDIETLGPLESAVMLDMLHCLMEVLGRHDTVLQETVMAWKYQLLGYRNAEDEPDNDLLKMTANNDLTDFIDDLPNASGIYPFPSASKPAPVQTGPRYEVTGTGLTPWTCNPEEGQTLKITNNPVPKHKRGRKGKTDKPEQPVTEVLYVMPPKNTKIVNYGARGKKQIKERHDGKYKSSMEGNDDIIDECKRKDHNVVYNIRESCSRQFSEERNVETINPNSGSLIAIEKFQEKVKKKLDLKRKFDDLNLPKTDSNMPFKKPKLYSLNPFCLPVPLLDLKPK